MSTSEEFIFRLLLSQRARYPQIPSAISPGDTSEATPSMEAAFAYNQTGGSPGLFPGITFPIRSMVF